MINRDELMRTMYLSVALLHEAYNRLQRLCEILPDPAHKQECTDTAQNIHAHATTLREHMALLLNDQDQASV